MPEGRAAAGLEVSELRAEPERTEADVRRYGNEVRNALHAKILILDREWLFVGSFNLDPRAVKLDSQNGMLIHNPQLAAQLAGRFEEAKSPAYTYRVTLSEGKLTWTCRKAGQTVEYHDDPETECGAAVQGVAAATWRPAEVVVDPASIVWGGAAARTRSGGGVVTRAGGGG